MKTLANYWPGVQQVRLAILLIFSTLIMGASASTISGPNTVCEGDVVTYTYPYSPGHTYNWGSIGGTGIATINTTNNTAVYTVTWGLAGSGSVSIQELLGASIVNTDLLNVTINDAPNPMIVSDFDSDCIDEVPKEHQEPRPPSFDCETVCEDSPVNYTTNFVAGNSYQWTVIGAYNSISGATTNSATVTWGSPGQAYVVVTETTPAGCTQTDTVCIEIVPKPQSKFKVDIGNSSLYSSDPVSATVDICVGGTVCFDDLSSGATSWFWDFGNGNTSMQQNPCETFNTPGGYTVMQVVENNCHCTDTTYIRVLVNQEEGPEIVCQNTICNNGTFIYDAILPTPCTGGFYDWSISNNGTIVSINGTGTTVGPQNASGFNSTSIEINWGSGPIGVISLRVGGCPGVCDRVTTVNIPIIPNTLDIEGDDVVCAGEFGNYQVPCFPGTVYTWKVNGATQTGNEHDFSYQFNSPGTYTITVDYTNSFLSCSGSSNPFTVTVLNPFSISGNDKVCEGSSITFSGPGSSQLNWQVKNQGGTVVASGGTSSSFTVPSIPPLAPGSYTVIAEDVSSPRDYCNDYAIHGFTVIAKPPAPTVINGPDEVCVGEVSIYTASPTSSDYYLEWEVNNGGSVTTSNGNSVSVTWNTGVKSITLYHVSKISDCKSSGYVLNITDKTPPPIAITGPTPVCANTDAGSPEVYSTTASLDGYIWSIAPANAGSVVGGQGTNTIDVIWNNYNGNADVTLTPTVCTTTFPDVTYTVNVTSPVMSISGTSNVCQNSTGSWSTSFTPAGAPGAYTWTVQNVVTGATVTLPGTGSGNSYTFPNSGSFIVSATVTNCGIVHTVTQNVTVDPVPVANLTFTGDINCIDNNSVNFYVSVQGAGSYSYEWFQSGTSLGFLGNSHTIGFNPADAGNYWVEITNNITGCRSVTNIVRVVVCGPPVICTPNGGSVSFNYAVSNSAPSPGCNVVGFNGTVSGPPPSGIRWYWNNTVIGTGLTPTYAFPASGVYPVTMVASYGSGICNNTYTIDVVVPVISDFELNISCAGNVFNVDLINTSDVVHGPLSSFNHSWTVYDVTAATTLGTSTSQDYLSVPGLVEGHVIEVTLTESLNYTWGGQTINALCTYVNTFTMPFKADADFSFMPTGPTCEGLPIEFTDLSTGNIVGWSWDFGDGSGILTQNTVRTYAGGGINSVELTVTDEFGCTSDYTDNVDIRDNNISGTIGVSPVMPMCPGTTATLAFTNTTSPYSGPYNYSWSDLSTGISTTASVTSTHYLAVTDSYGCAESFGPETVEVVEIPLAVINGEDEYCVGDEINLVCNYGSSYTYEWFENISGGGYVSAGTGTDFSIASAVVGTHLFKVELTTAGCTKESLVFTVTVHPNPVAPIITTNPTPACPGPVQLTVTNSGAFNHVTWSTGDVNFTTDANTSGTYYAVGTDANGCSNYSSTVVHELPDFCSFMCGCYSDCIDNSGTYNFPGILGSYSLWRWERFVSGSWTTVSSGSGTVPDYVATGPGVHTIRLYVVTYDGCDGYSCEVDLTLVPCDVKPCEGDAKMRKIYCEYDADLGVVYGYSMDINFAPFGAPCSNYTYSIIAPSGTIQQGSTSITPYGATVNGLWYTGVNYYPGGVVCFDIIITNPCDGTSCMFTVCFDVKDCGRPGSDKRLKSDIQTSANGDIEFYPNPTSGMLKIKASEEGNYEIAIFDLSGKVVLKQTVNMDNVRTVEFNLENLPEGLYSLQCIGNGTIQTEQLIILKD